MYQLPESTLKLPECSAAPEAAQNLLLEEIGDLEVTWGDEQKQKQLLELPFQGLKQLLQHQQTKVASEDTVLYTIHRWLTRESNAATTQEQQELANTIRVTHCSPLCVGTIIPRCPWLVQAWGVEDLVAASVFACKPEQKRVVTCLSGGRELMKRQPASGLNSRPVSAVTKGGLLWKVPVSKMKELDETARAKNSAVDLRSHEDGGGILIWSGRVFYLKVEGSNVSGIGLYLIPNPSVNGGDGARAVVMCSLGAVNTFGNLICRKQYAVEWNLSEFHGHGWKDVCSLKGWATWEELEQKLRGASLVHADGCLHLRLLVHSIS